MQPVQGALPINRTNRLIQSLYRPLLAWEKPYLAAVLTGLIIFGISLAVRAPWRLSAFPYYNYLADAFLHGQYHLRAIPANTQDLSLFQGRYYLYWGPLPAVVLIPFVAVFGTGFSDILQTIVIGAFNAGIFALLLRRVNQRGLIQLEPLQRGLLVIFFALGTAQTPLMALGTVWRIAQLLTISFALLAYLATVSFENQKAFFWTGCAMACALATRLSVVFVAIFLGGYLLQRHWHAGFRHLFKYCLAGIAPVAGVGLLLLGYNAVRFGNPSENGISYHLMSSAFREMYAQYGVLSLHYIPTNVYLNFIYYPFLTLRPLSIWPMGGSLFLLSPLYFAAIAAIWENRKASTTWLLFLSILVGSIPSLMIMAPGSVNFGPRYLLDIAPPLLLLTAMGIRRWPIPFVILCVLISVSQYLIGTLLMLPTWG